MIRRSWGSGRSSCSCPRWPPRWSCRGGWPRRAAPWRGSTPFKVRRPRARGRGAGAARPRPPGLGPRARRPARRAAAGRGPHGPARSPADCPARRSRWPSRGRCRAAPGGNRRRSDWTRWRSAPGPPGGPRPAARPWPASTARSTRRSRAASPTPPRSCAPPASTCGQARWLRDAEVLVVDDLELDAPRARRSWRPSPARFPCASSRRDRARRPRAGVVRGLGRGTGPRLRGHGRTPSLAPLARRRPRRRPRAAARRGCSSRPAASRRRDDSVELLTAPGEAAEVRAIVRRLLREAARGVPFEEMGVILPRPDTVRAALHRPAAATRRPPPAAPVAAAAHRPRGALAAAALPLPRAAARRGDGVPDLRAGALRRAPGRRARRPRRRSGTPSAATPGSSPASTAG